MGLAGHLGLKLLLSGLASDVESGNGDSLVSMGNNFNRQILLLVL